MNMLVEIESFFGDRLITGEKCSKEQLQAYFDECVQACNKNQTYFTAIFCQMFGFQELPYKKDYYKIMLDGKYVKIDFVIDLDTHLVYAPLYDEENIALLTMLDESMQGHDEPDSDDIRQKLFNR